MPFRSVYSLGNYEGLLKDLVVRMKSRNGSATAIQLGNLLASKIGLQIPTEQLTRLDAVVPVPSHWMRQLRRGFDVAHLISESVGNSIEIQVPVRPWLTCRRRVKKQGTLTIKERFQNVKGCFQVSSKRDLHEKGILLVDDVMTSGATAIQAANELIKAGAGEVHLGIVARGVGKQS